MNKILTTYSGKSLSLFQVTRQHIWYWRKIGLLPPRRRNAPKGYTFQELLSIKVIVSLTRFGVRASKVKKTMDALRNALPEFDYPLTQKRLYIRGKEIFIKEGDKVFEPRTGQILFYDMADCAASLRIELIPYIRAAA